MEGGRVIFSLKVGRRTEVFFESPTLQTKLTQRGTKVRKSIAKALWDYRKGDLSGVFKGHINWANSHPAFINPASLRKDSSRLVTILKFPTGGLEFNR